MDKRRDWQWSMVLKSSITTCFLDAVSRFYQTKSHYSICSVNHIQFQSWHLPGSQGAWALTLSAYTYSITYKPGVNHANADVLSCLPLPEAPTDIPLLGETVLLIETLHEPMSAKQIKDLTARDPLLSSVWQMVLHGWCYSSDEKLRPFNQRKDELSEEGGCVLWGSRVIIPQSGQATVLEELHQGHPEVCRMKALARGVMWWPGMDGDIEEMVKECHQCQVNRKSPAAAPLHPWEWPAHPWASVHIDHAGPFLGKNFLVVTPSG